jgi:tetratricopeptide (TPR) repeat protein
MPKAALAKLTKLAPLCTEEKEIYAVSMATAQVQMLLGKPLPAIREYTRALGLHPTSQGAIDLGSCHQRLGNLDKARDSYEFALDLEPENLEARAILATTYVADGDYYTALEQAQMVLEKNEKHASALATAAICHGLLNDPVLCKYYTEQATENGYSKTKIEDTISTLKKRVK